MKTTLVMGGTKFFGKCLVGYLLKDSYDVTIATRGQTKDSFGNQVDRIEFDRTDLASMEQAFNGKKYDIVFDQIGYCGASLADACKVFAGKTGHYVFTSSNVVYSLRPVLGLIEADFDPLKTTCTGDRFPEDVDYCEGKRQAEAYLAQHAPFPFAAVRFPMVMGLGDPTGRLDHLVGHILDKKPIVIPANYGIKTYVNANDAGRFLIWLGTTRRTGSYNAASDNSVDPIEMTKLAGRTLGIEPIIIDQGPKEDHTDYAEAPDMTIDVSKARQEGFEFTPFEQWFPTDVKETALAIKNNL
jgi:nucleoside-diphosphate-sugar epimerase